MAAAAKQYEEKVKTAGPQNDDELHAWILKNIGIDVPRVAVCGHTDPPHCAPFKFLADLYFERVDSALAMANRGGAKTFLVALLHYLNSVFKPECESCTFGAVENQSDRAYNHLKLWVYDKNGEKRPEIVSSLRKETVFRNGSRVEILGSTPEQVNGPHPQKAHADEIELMRDDTWKESRGMAISKNDSNGRMIKAQNILTSTRKGPRGRMQELIDVIEEAKKENLAQPYELYAWCIKEVTAQVPNCREAPENFGRPEEELCKCDMYRNGFWDDDSDRYLNQVCNGDFHKSRGWKPYQDITEAFMQNSRAVWESQHECAKTLTENLIVPQFSEKRNVVKYFLPNPKNGPVYMGVDWGGTAANAVSWYQLLEYPVKAWNHDLQEIVIPANSLVCFDELYEPDIPPSKLGDRVHANEDAWRTKLGMHYQVQDRFPDPQGRGARNEWAQMTRPLVTHFTANRDVEQQITYIHELIEDGRFFVDANRCPMFVAEILAWKRDPKTGNEVREFNHQMSAFRYAVANIRMVNARIKKKRMSATEQPVGASDRVRSSNNPSPVSIINNEREGESWRKRFTSAQPATNPVNSPFR